MIRINQLAVLIALVAVAIYFWLVASYAINAPFRDDLLDILGFALNWVDSNSPAEQWQALLAQHNDHRTAASRLVYLLTWTLSGEINFILLSVLLNLVPLAFLLFFYHQLPTTDNRALMMLPVALLLFQPSSWALMLYPMAGLAMFGMLLYAMLALVCLNKPGLHWLAIAILCAILSTFSLAAGQLVWLFGIVPILTGEGRAQHQKLLHLAIWVMAAIVALGIFHYEATSPNTASTLVFLALETPLEHLTFLLVSVGNVIGMGRHWVAGITGLLMLVLLPFLLLFRGRPLSVLMVFACFLVAVCLAITLGRAGYAPLEAAAGSKFSMPSALLLCCLWILTCRVFPGLSRQGMLIVGAIALLFNIASLVLYQPRLADTWEARNAQLQNQRYPLFGRSAENTQEIVERSEKLGIYNPPTRSKQ